MSVTEEGIPIRTIYVPELTINATTNMLRDHFREFGAIERVVISPERIHGNEPVDAANPVDFFNQEQNGQRNYFAYVTYVAVHGAETALRNPRQTIQNHVTDIRPAFSWNQPNIHVQEYLTRVRTPNEVERSLYDEMERLNDDCFLHILKYLGVLEIIRVTRSHQNLRAAAVNHRHIRIDRAGDDTNCRMTLMQLRELLRELPFGANISSLYITSRMFSCEAMRYVCDRLYCYIGPQLRSLTMAQFNLRCDQFARMQPLLVNLEYFDADYSSGFGFQAFNADWDRLQTLHIRTYGQLDRFLDGTERLPTFPVLTRLLLQCNFLNSQTLIERVVNSCPNLIEFIAINISDIFTDMSRLYPVQFNRLIELQQLQRLVLSLTRRHYPNNFIEIICQMTGLQYLMIDVVKNRLRDDQPMEEVNRNLATLAASLPQLKELQLIGVVVDNANVLGLIDVAVNLETIAILECPRFSCVPNFVRSIVDRRRELFRNAGLATKQLKIIIDESMFDNVRLNENDLGDLVILRHATCFDLYKNYLPSENVDYMQTLRTQHANAHAQHEHLMNMVGRRDNFFIRNDDGPIFGRHRRMMGFGRGVRPQREGVIIEINFGPNDEPGRAEPGRADEFIQQEIAAMEHFDDFNRRQELEQMVHFDDVDSD